MLHIADSFVSKGGSHKVPGEGIVSKSVCGVVAEFQEVVGMVHQVKVYHFLFFTLNFDC